ncbi:MAG: hypothetical protein WA405_06210 [Candidatus Acidiferrales bacterium]
MSKKLSTRLPYALAFSILLLTTGFLGFAVHLFASARTADTIFLVSFVIVVEALLLYFLLHRPLAKSA